MLVGRLFSVMDKRVSFNQTSFLKDRFLVGGVVVVNELTDLDKKSKNSCFIFKMDFGTGLLTKVWRHP